MTETTKAIIVPLGFITGSVIGMFAFWVAGIIAKRTFDD